MLGAVTSRLTIQPPRHLIWNLTQNPWGCNIEAHDSATKTFGLEPDTKCLETSERTREPTSTQQSNNQRI
ncbi:hypothetical protein RRG08_008670 [Elysia crispata]|uniref:Uncharacterized protein n=1 Tax=Elysia crispata TaxID=231223 RepID=A0AAE1CP53_9GAST|nr:hypothetical protein RRG08_008670 [Elysia crispata]